MSEYRLCRLTSSVFIAASLAAEPGSFGGIAAVVLGIAYFVTSLFCSKD